MTWRGFPIHVPTTPSDAYDQVSVLVMTLLQAVLKTNVPFKGWYVYHNEYGRWCSSECKHRKHGSIVMSGLPCRHRVNVDCHRFLDEAIEMTDLVWEVIVALDPYLQHFMLITVLVFDLIWDMNWGLRKEDMLKTTLKMMQGVRLYLNIGVDQEHTKDINITTEAYYENDVDSGTETDTIGSPDIIDSADNVY